MKGSDLLVSALENEGVERIFSVPGEENLDVVELLRRSSIKLIVTRHEQAASFMAATQGRLTGRPGVCLATLGPGALNLTTGAAFALLGAMPMVMITGQKGILSRKQGRFQVVDIVATMAPLTKMARQIVSPATIPTTVREAFRLAQQERPGPVHLELPEDIAGEEVPEIPLVKLHPIDIPVADSAALDRAADLILKAERPLVMLGAAASRPRLAGPLSDFVRRVRIPFFNTQMGKGSVTGGSGLYMGTGTKQRASSEVAVGPIPEVARVAVGDARFIATPRTRRYVTTPSASLTPQPRCTRTSVPRVRRPPQRPPEGQLAARPLLDRVDAVWIEGEIVPDGRYRRVRRFIGPDSVGGAHTAQRNAVVCAVALVGAVGGVVRSREQRHVDVLARDVLDRRVARFAERQRLPRIGHNTAGHRHHDPTCVALDADRVIGARNLHGLGLRFDVF